MLMLSHYIGKEIEGNQDVALQTFLYQYSTTSFILFLFCFVFLAGTIKHSNLNFCERYSFLSSIRL